MSQADRYNEGKTELSLLLSAPNALKGCTKVLEFGAKKYSRNNWKKGMPYSKIVDSLMRHLVAFMDNENLDPDSKLPHVDHIMCNALFLSEIVKIHANKFDDRKNEDTVKHSKNKLDKENLAKYKRGENFEFDIKYFDPRNTEEPILLVDEER